MSDEMRRQREDWRRHRESLRLVDVNADDFASGGLAALASPLDIRVVILPADPQLTDAVPLDQDTAAWIEADRPSVYGGQQMRWGHTTRATSGALARVYWYQEDESWDRYLAVHRHGGVEAGLTRLSWEDRERKYFSLRHMVAAMWLVAELQTEAAANWGIAGPWEVTLALRGTKAAVLAGFADGWAEPHGYGPRPGTCGESSVLHRWELSDIDPEALAIDAGARLENSFGSTNRRHLARVGEYEGGFDPQFGW